MFRRIVIFLITLQSVSAWGQKNPFADQTWDFGDVVFWNNDTAWFTVRNATEKDLTFLPTYYNENFQVFYSSRNAAPGESIKIGITYYSSVKGKFNVEIPLYINLRGEPIHFRLKGNIKSFDPMAQLRCPVVNAGTEPNNLQKIITVEVRDIETEELLMPDELTVKSRNNQRIRLEEKDMIFRMAVTPGNYRVTSAKKGYHDYFAAITLEPYQLKYVVYLEKKPVEEIQTPEPPDPVAYRSQDSNDAIGVTINGDVHLHPEPIMPGMDTLPVPESSGLNEKEYKYNNIVIIVDVSASMNRNGKLDGLKSAFNIMVDAMRPGDRLAIIAMSSQAEVLQEPVGVYEKDSLKARMGRMKAGGSTNGGAAIQTAYQLAHQNFMTDGNNQVIIATDGVFYGGTLTRKQIEQLIEKGNEDGIHLSTVGLGNDPKAMMFLTGLSEKGGGSQVQIQNPETSEHQLLEMIKSQSRR